MSEPTPHRNGFDWSNPADRDHARRIGVAWIELRRGAGSAALREYLYGRDNVLEQGQMDALDLLVRRDRAMKGLAERLHIDPSSATRAVQRLVKAGLAERYPSDEDGRVVMVRITNEGRRRHGQVSPRRNRVLAHIVGSFDAEDRALLADLLERMTDSIDDLVATLDHDDDDRTDDARNDEVYDEDGDAGGGDGAGGGEGAGGGGDGAGNGDGDGDGDGDGNDGRADAATIDAGSRDGEIATAG